eukprot:1317317-Amorphochlora_amoeboformis.AAC.1
MPKGGHSISLEPGLNLNVRVRDTVSLSSPNNWTHPQIRTRSALAPVSVRVGINAAANVGVWARATVTVGADVRGTPSTRHDLREQDGNWNQKNWGRLRSFRGLRLRILDGNLRVDRYTGWLFKLEIIVVRR